MTLPHFVFRRLAWINLPGALLVALLQRTPALRIAAATEEFVMASPIGAVLRSAVAATATLGALHSLAGATQFSQSTPNPVRGTVGQQLAVSFTITGSPQPPVSFTIDSPLPPGMATIPAMQGNKVQSETPTIAGTPTQAGTFNVNVTGSDGVFSETDTITFIIDGGTSSGTPPSVTTQPAVAQSSSRGGSASFTIAVSGSPAPSIQWQLNGNDLSGANGTTFTVSDVEPATAGVYRALVANASGSVASNFAILGVGTAAKVIGAGAEVGTDIQHPNGNIFDQVLLQGAAATVTADPGQVLRISYVDLNDNIVQVEFAGAGTLSVVLDNASGPAPPVKYNQAVNYMKGHAGIVVVGANQTTNLSVFSVGKATAVNQALFKDPPNEGFANIAFVAISSVDGKFGGLRTANASYFNTKGATGVYAPNVEFTGPVFVGDINASDNATPLLLIGAGANTQINGGDLQQANGRAIQVSGLTQLKFVQGSNSHGIIFPAQSNKGKLEQNGTDVTAQVVVNPSN